MAKYKSHPRFFAGGLVMFSLKNQESGKIYYVAPEGATYLQDKWYSTFKFTGEKIVDEMPRGVPFLLIEDPEYVDFKVTVSGKKEQ